MQLTHNSIIEIYITYLHVQIMCTETQAMHLHLCKETQAMHLHLCKETQAMYFTKKKKNELMNNFEGHQQHLPYFHNI